MPAFHLRPQRSPIPHCLTTGPAAEHSQPDPPRFGAFLRYFLGLGTWGFGGPIASVGYMQRDLVQRRGWLTEREFLDGVALGQTMPGPLAAQVVMWIGFLRKGSAATFIGYLVAGLPGALVATVAIFTPIYLGVTVPGRWFVRHRDSPQIKAFVKGATAAAAGVIAGAVIVLTRQTITDSPTAAIAAIAISLGLLLRRKIPEPVFVALGAVAGILLH